jgi:SAM-dependent methyltransferase
MKQLPDVVRWHIRVKEKTSKNEALYIARIIKLFQRKLKKKHLSILDVACGNGRLHPFLRKKGFEVFGIDSSKELIEEARKKYPKFYDCYYQAEMRKFDLKRKFDVALSWFTSFGYFGDKENLRALKNISKHLRKNSLFLLDIPNGPLRINHLQSNPNFVLRQDNFVEIVDNRLAKIGNQIFWILKQSFYLKKGKDLKFLKKKSCVKLECTQYLRLLSYLTRQGSK